MKQYAIYLMDADDTLFDFQKAERCAFYKTFEALSGQACTEETYAKYSQLNRSLWEALERREITKPQLQETRFGLFLKEQGLSGDGLIWNETYLDHLAEGNFLFDGALQVCRELSQKAALYLATNGVTRVQKKRLRDSAIAPYVYFDHVMKRLGNPGKEQILMVGDSLTSDMAGGIAAGIDTCWYNPRRKPLPPSLKVTWQIHSLEQLLPPSMER